MTSAASLLLSPSPPVHLSHILCARDKASNLPFYVGPCFQHSSLEELHAGLGTLLL